MAYLGTNNALEVERRIAEGDEKARLVYDGMTYQVAKHIASLAAVINGKVDVLHDIHNLEGKCPLCGDTMVKTCKGYICKNGIGTKPTCG